MNASDRLLQLNLVRQLLLQRLVADEQNKVLRLLDNIAAKLKQTIDSGEPLNAMQTKRLDRQIADLTAMVQVPPPDLKALPRLEADYANSTFELLGVTDATLPPAAALERIAETSLVQGATVGQWFTKLNEATRFDIERTIRTGVALGQTNGEIVSELIGRGDKGGQPIAKAKRDANAIVRTSVQTIANDARMAFYDENDDMIKAVQWVSTLDGRTSEVCMARSGKTWSFPDFRPQGHNIPWNGGPPAHWSCRSTSIPVLKTLREMGIDRDNFEQTTRASMDGQVAADLGFDEFLKSKPPEFADKMLGKGRAQLWRDGKITLSDLLNQKGNPLSLKELEAKYGRAVEDMTPTPAAAVPAARAEVDAVIKAVRAFSYSDEYQTSKAAFTKAEQDYLAAYQAYREAGLAERGPLMTVASERYTDYIAARKTFRAIEVPERKRAVSLLDLPAARQGNPADIINGAVSPAVRTKVAEASSIVTKLVDKDILPKVSIAISRRNRAHYNAFSKTININGKTSLSTVVHEIIHDLEFRYPEISAKTKAFLLKRADGQAPKSLRRMTGIKYGPAEVAYEDEWKKRGGNPYSGKVYPDAATEVLTMGVERLIADPKGFVEQDPDYFRFLLEVLRKVD